MSGWLEKRRKDGAALDIERQLMQEALARLGPHESETRLRGRLIFALDLTGSREHSLREARIATAGMFEAIKGFGRIAVKLVYYRGEKECRATGWHDDPDVLSSSMRRLSCKTGNTQIARLLRMACAAEETLAGVVFVGDHCEEDASELVELAKALRGKTTPLFVFHECADHDQHSLNARRVFERMAEASGGVYVEFKPDSGAVLRELLSTIAAFAAAGTEGVRQAALPETTEARQLQGQLLRLGTGDSR